MRIAIVGAGAIGCLFGLRLKSSGQSVLLIHHDERTVATISRRGVTVQSPSGEKLTERIEIKPGLSKGEELDLVLLTVKAYDTRSTGQQLARSLKGNVPVVSLQNGLGNIEALWQYLPKRAILAATTTEAALRVRRGEIIHTGKGLTWIGELDGTLSRRVHNIATIFGRAGFNTLATRNVQGVIWSKAIVNSAINPITALTGVTNNKVGTVSPLRESALRLISEGIHVANAAGVSPIPSPRTLLSRVLASSRNNRSSMLRDLETGKKTEIRNLNGEIARLGKRLRVETPYNSLLAELILGVEESREN